MKKILTASLVAIMAVTAANADIASTQYVNAKAGADENGVFTFQGDAEGKTNLTEAINAVATKVVGLSADIGDGGAVSEQIGSAIGGLDSTQSGTGTVVKSVSQTDGKVSVTVGTIADADVAAGAAIAQSKIANLTGDLAAKQTKDNIVSLDSTNQLPETVDNPNEKYPSYSAAAKMVDDGIAVLTEGVSDQINDINELLDKKADQATTLAGYGITDAYTKTETEGQITAAKTELQGKIQAVVDGGLKAGSVDGTAIKSGTITETQLNTSVNASLDKADSALQKADIATGTANGTIKVEGVDVAVAGLGTAAYKADTAFDAAGSATAAEGRAKAYTDEKVNGLDAEAEAVGTNDGSYVTAVAQTDGKIKVSTVAFDTALNAASTNAVQNKVVNTAIEGIKTNLGGLNGKNIANVPEACAAGGNGTCSLVMKNGVATWEVVKY